MAKYKVKKKFYGKKEEQSFNPEDHKEVEMTVKRGDEIIDKLGDDYLERIDKKEATESEEK